MAVPVPAVSGGQAGPPAGSAGRYAGAPSWCGLLASLGPAQGVSFCADTEAAKALHRRCSAQTLMRRHHGPVDEADRCLPHLLSPHFGWALTAESPAGELLALGRLLWDGPETEVAPLVEDAWQARGIGGALLRWLMDLAVETSCPSVYAVTQPGNTGLIGALRGTGPPLSLALSEGVLVITTQPVQLPVAAGVRRAGG